MLSSKIFRIKTLLSYHTIQYRCNLIHFGVLYRKNICQNCTFQVEIGILHYSILCECMFCHTERLKASKHKTTCIYKKKSNIFLIFLDLQIWTTEWETKLTVDVRIFFWELNVRIWKWIKVYFLKYRTLDKTVQTRIRLLLKKRSDQCLPCLLFWRAFCEFHPR